MNLGYSFSYYYMGHFFITLKFRFLLNFAKLSMCQKSGGNSLPLIVSMVEDRIPDSPRQGVVKEKLGKADSIDYSVYHQICGTGGAEYY